MRRGAGPLVALLLFVSPAAAQDGSWLRSLPGGGRSGCCFGLDTDAAGNGWFTGVFEGQGALQGPELNGRGGSDVLLTKLGPDGRVVWTRLGGGAGRDHPTALAVTAGGSAYVAGAIGGDARFGEHFLPYTGTPESFLACYSPAGRCLWARKLAGQGDDGVRSIVANPRGGAVVAGTFVRQFSRGDVPEVYVANFDPEGTQRWFRRAEGTGRSLAVGVDDAGIVYVAGSSPAADPGGGRQPAEGWPLVLAFDGGGSRWRWEPARRAAPEDEDGLWGRAVALAAVPDGGCWVAGEILGMVRVGDVRLPGLRDRDVFLAKLDSAGELLWSVRVGGADDDHVYDVAACPDGGCVISGTFRGTARFPPWEARSTGAEDLFVAVYDADGNCRRVDTGTGPGVHSQEVLPYEVACGADGAVWTAGWYTGFLRVAGRELAGGTDGTFLARWPVGGSGP